MKPLILLPAFIFFFFQASGQNCKPNIGVTVSICGTRLPKDSAICGKCNDCQSGLKSSDSNFHIISFVLTADGEGFGDNIEEAINTGAAFNEARRILIRVRPGSNIEFSCIKAKYRDSSVTYLLQPLYLKIK
jgi:hypothetical protein